MVRPDRHLAARRRAQDPGRRRRGADVRPRAGSCCERVLAEVDPRQHRGQAAPGRDRRRRGHRPAGRRPGWRRCRTPALVAACSPAHPIRELVTDRGSLPGVRRPRRARCSAAGTSSSRAPRAPPSTPRPATVASGTFRTAAEAARRRGRDGLRRHLPAADPPDRRGQPQGPQQHADPGPRRHRAHRGRSARKDGGHDAIHPDLGTFEDFDAFVAQARDARPRGRARPRAAVRARPPVGRPSHPEWFTTRADGTIAYAENPPKKYQDIYPINFDNDPIGICREVLRVVQLWMSHGVRIFRVDNPHTKPVAFWEWLLARDPPHRPRRALPVRGVHPAGDDARRSARSASTSPTPTSPGAPPSGRSRTTSARCPTRPTT